MSERDSQIQRDVEIDIGTGIDEPADSVDAGSESGRLESLVSPTAILAAVILSVVASIAFGSVPLLGFVGELLGVVVAGFLYGLVVDSRHYLELAVAGALVGGGFALLNNLVITLLGAGIPLVVFGIVGGALAGVVGHYFGRDLRDGLTRDI